jgi:3-isopropylmalate/(R)-2-methylmalate dehydratase large subunit
MVVDVDGKVPEPDAVPGYSRKDVEQALDYMGLKPGTPITDIRPDTIFIGSCTNARIEDLRKVAAIIKGRKKAPSLRVMVVPGSMAVRRQAEAKGWIVSSWISARSGGTPAAACAWP